MQSSQRAETATASAISSFVFASSAFDEPAATASAPNAFITSGAAVRRSRKFEVSVFANSGQSCS